MTMIPPTGQSNVCPKCGYCPHCGRSNQPTIVWTQPQPYTGPTYYPTITVGSPNTWHGTTVEN